MHVDVGIIGGSGLYRMDGFRALDELDVETPFGRPSGPIVAGEMSGVRVAFLPRHGAGHRLPPDRVPYRANIFALKALGASSVIAVNAVGSLDIDCAPGHLVVPDDLFDRTYGRPMSFFEEGLVAHVGFGRPYCPSCRSALLAAREAADTNVHGGGTLVVTQGPRFSTRAESRFFRDAGFRIVGMTSLPEAALAREAEMCYVTLAVVTDYDVWHESEDDVTVDMVLATMQRTVAQAQRLITAALPAVADPARSDCDCRHALASAITTARDAIDPSRAEALAPILGPNLDGADA